MFKRKWLIWLVSTFLITTMVLSLGIAGSAAERATLKVIVCIDAERFAYDEQLARMFESAYPNVKIELTNAFGEAYDSKLLVMIAGGAPPDIGWWNDGVFPAFVGRDVLLDLGSYIEKDDEMRPEDIFPSVLDMVTYKGKKYGIPYTWGAIPFAYNKKMLTEAGLGRPDPFWTVDDFLEIGKKLTKDTDGDGVVDQWAIASNNWVARWYEWILRFGGDIFDESLTECTLNTPEAIEGLQFWADLTNKYRVAASVAEMGGSGEWQMFLSQRVAFYGTGPWDRPWMISNPDLDWDVLHPPVAKKRAIVSATDGNFVLKSTEYPQEAYEYCSWLAKKEAQEVYAETGRVPVRKLVAYDLFLATPPPPAHREIFLEASGFARSFVPQVVQWKEISETILPEMDRVLLGVATAKEVCELVTPKIDELLKKGF